MAIVTVLWTIALLTALAVSLLFTGNVSSKLARNALQVAQQDAIAEAAVSRAVLALLDPRVDKRWRPDGAPQDFRFDAVPVRIRIQDELGRIDLNHADESLLINLFRLVLSAAPRTVPECG
jgi:general secretion pathway protein K